MEVCVDCIRSALNAEKGGATRIELCTSLLDGGLTPSLGFLEMVKNTLKIPVFVLIRARGGDFCYSDTEVEIMRKDIEFSREHGADGFVIGALKPTGELDNKACETLLKAAKPLPVTLHRAFDLTRDADRALEDAIAMGFDRILTSGQASNAFEGIKVLRKLNENAGNRITIMPGGGITQENLAEILSKTKAKEFHSSASDYIVSSMEAWNTAVSMGDKSNELQWKECSPEKVAKLMAIAQEVWKS